MRSLLLFLFACALFAQPPGGAQPLRPLNPPPIPAGNPITAAKTQLGKALFWDEQLSSTRTVACGTCHIPASGGSDPRSSLARNRGINPGTDGIFGNGDDVVGSLGVPVNFEDGNYGWSVDFGMLEQVTGRKAPSAINAAYSATLFWDGRAGSSFADPFTGQVIIPNGGALENQVLGPPVSGSEMAHQFRDWHEVADRIASAIPLQLSPRIPASLSSWIAGRDYLDLFDEAFGTPEVTPTRIALAIATYERTLISNQTPLDTSLRGGAPLTAQEQRGMAIFLGRGNCVACHSGPLLSDNQFHNIGVRPTAEDQGRYGVTGLNRDLGAFRTPALRNVALRAPYFHNGRLTSLEDVINFYNRGGDFNAPNKDPRIRPLNLNANDRAALAAFLRRPLTDPRLAAGTGPFERPQLYGGSPLVPQILGQGVAGSGGRAPRPIAIAPPLLGNPNFTLGLQNALGGAQAVLVIDDTDPGTGPTIPANGELARETIQLQGSGVGAGYGSISLVVPTDSSLRNRDYFARWYVLDPGARGGVAVSQLIRFRFFQSGASP